MNEVTVGRALAGEAQASILRESRTRSSLSGHPRSAPRKRLIEPPPRAAVGSLAAPHWKARWASHGEGPDPASHPREGGDGREWDAGCGG